MDGLAGKVALVTGASRGIGAATARRLASGGAAVVLAARSGDAIAALAEEIIRDGGRATAQPTDLRQTDAIDALFDRIATEFKELDIVVNNAGVLPQARRIERCTRDEWDYLLSLNLTAAWHVSSSAKKLMPQGGTIVNITSTAASYPSIGLGAYCVSKAALDMLTRACALEWARDGVRVVGVVPGKIDTEMVTPIVEYLQQKGQELNPLGRVGTPEEVADLIAYLVSDRASYITGALIAIDGGELIAAGA